MLGAGFELHNLGYRPFHGVNQNTTNWQKSCLEVVYYKGNNQWNCSIHYVKDRRHFETEKCDNFFQILLYKCKYYCAHIRQKRVDITLLGIKIH